MEAELNRILIIFFCMLSVFLFACATPVEKPSEVKEEIEEIKEVQVEDAKPQVYTKAQIETLDIFTQILEIYENAASRQEAAQKAEVLYARIINEYPQTPLAQESYWKLITLTVRDFSPPDFEKAEKLYNEFMVKYPGSILKNAVQQTLIQSYNRYAEWGRMIKLCAPAFMEYKKGSKEPAPLILYMYAEANYRLGNIAEAEEGYKATLKLYPKISYAMKAKKRLDEIGKKEEKE